MTTGKDELDLALRAEQLYLEIQRTNHPASDEGTGLPKGVGSVLHLLATLQSRDNPSDGGNQELRGTRHETNLTIGRFRLSEFLGEGAHGVVYLADDTMLDRIVALKLPKPYVLFTPHLRMRFLREARAAAKIHHPHVVQVYDASEANELSFIASEYCSGGSLADWLTAEHDNMPPSVAARLIADLADAVDHAHQLGILHRDIKPSNIQLAPTDTPIDGSFPFTVKLADFGLAKSLVSDEQHTRTGELVGTVRYMAPELILGTQEASAAADVYGLGIVLYQLLCGRVPFDGISDAAILHRTANSQPIDVASLCDAPKDLAAICMKSIERSVDRRYTSAADLAADLQRFVVGDPTIARPLSRTSKIVRWAKRNPTSSSLIGMVVFGLLLGVLGLAYHNQQLAQAINELAAQKRVSDIARDDSVRSAAIAENRGHELIAQQRNMATSHYAADMNLAFQALDAQMPRLVQRRLAEHDNSSVRSTDLESFDPRGFEWDFLKRIVSPRRVIVCEGLTAPHVAISRRSSSLLLASELGPARVLALEDFANEQILSPLKHSREVAVCTHSGRSAIAHRGADDKSVITVYAPTGELEHAFGGQETTIDSLVFSHGGQLIASGSRYSDVIIWRLNGERVIRFENASRNESVAFSPDDRLFAFSFYDSELDRDSVRVLETESWSGVAEIPITRKDEVLCFSPDGRHLVVSSKYKINVYSTENFKRVQVFDGGRSQTSVLGFSDDGSLFVAATKDGVLRWWECENDLLPDESNALGVYSVGAVSLHEGRINSIAFQSHDQVFTAGEDGRVICTDLPCSVSFLSTDLNGEKATQLIRSSQGFVVTALRDGRDVVVSPEGKQTVLTNHRAPDDSAAWLRRIAISPDSTKLASVVDDQIAVTQLERFESTAEFAVDGAVITDIEFVANDTLAVVEEDQPHVAFWSINGVKSKSATFPSPVLRIAVSPSRKDFVVAIGGAQGTKRDELRVYDWKTNRTISQAPCSPGVMSLTISRDGTILAAGSADGIVELFSMPDLRRTLKIDSQRTQRMWAVAFSNDMKTIATGGTSGSLQLWQIKTGRCLGALLENSRAEIVGLDIEADGSIICAFNGVSAPVRRISP